MNLLEQDWVAEGSTVRLKSNGAFIANCIDNQTAIAMAQVPEMISILENMNCCRKHDMSSDHNEYCNTYQVLKEAGVLK